MLNSIIGFAIRNKLIIGLFTLALIGYGSYEVTKLPIDAVPDITNNQVQVITVAPSFGATDIERLVTFPIEQANNNIHGLLEIRSFSRFGLSLVTIVFDDETDIYWARQQVAERLQKVQSQIPAGIGVPELGPVSTGLGEIYQYVVRPKEGYESKYDATSLRTIQDWIVRRQLLGVKGVAEVSSFGGKLKQFSIEIDPHKLQATGITIDDVFKALENNNQNTGGAYIEKGSTALFIRTEGLIGSIEDIENIAIKSLGGGTPLFIRDVAEIKIGHATRFGAMTFNDKGEVAGAVVMMLKGANSSEVIKNVKERVAQIQKTLPEGVLIEPFLDRTKMVNNAIGTVEKNLLEGALIVIFVLVLFLGNFRAGILVASVIPLSMLFAIIMMNLFGVSGNLMSLGALDFGLIVDGAVIIVESVMHLLAGKHALGRANYTQAEMDEMTEKSAGKMMNSAVFGQVIILVVYLPIFTLQGIEGKMFKPMAQTVAFALLGAFILSLTYIPMMSSIVLSKKTKHEPNISDRLMAKIEHAYQSALNWVLNFPKVILGATIGLFVLAIIVLSTLGGEFIPALEEGDFAVETRVLTGSNLSTTIENTQKTAHILKTRFPEVEKVVTKIGSGEVPTDPMPMDACDMMVILKDKSEWTSAKTFDELAEKMTKELSEVPGVTVGFQYPVQMRFNELMTGARQDVVCKIFGEDLDTLTKYAHQLGEIINTVEGAKNLYVETVSGMPQVLIEYKRNMIAQYNLSVADINRVVNTALAGQSTGLVFEGEKRFDLVVRLAGDQKKNLEDIQNLLIPTPNGTQIALSQLADVAIKDGPNQIQREDAKRRIVVGFNVRGRDVQSIVTELQGKVDKKIRFSAGYYVTYGGAFENLNAAKQRLMIAVPVSLILIFLLLFFAFNSIKHGLLIYSAIPLSAIGGIFFLALRGLPFSISAGVGFIALFGVAVLNGIVLIAEFNRIKHDGEHDLRKVVLEGTNLRLRPVLMTAFVASLGFLPMALSNGAGAEVQRPLATVVIGGLLIATFLTLFVLPILYMVFEGTTKVISPKATIIVLLLLAGASANAQKPVSLESAVEIALKNNLSVKNEKIKAEYQKSLINTAKMIPTTNIAAEVGQINSIYLDSRLSLGQTLSFPKVYESQKNYYNELWKSSTLSIALTEHELKKQVGQVYYHWVYLQQKRQLLQFADSLYKAFLNRAELRFAKGESNILEKVTAENQLGQINVQLKQVEDDEALTRLRFQYLLNSAENFVPANNSYKLSLKNQPIIDVLKEHPSLKFLSQQQQIADAAIDIEKKKLLPTLSMVYNNGSIRGTGADNVVYNGWYRFQSVQVGMGIPIFATAQKAKINSEKVNKLVAESNYEVGLQTLNNAYLTALGEYNKFTKTVEYYEKTALNNANIINGTAQQQLINGSINYLEWVTLTNQATTIRNDYIEAIRNLNQSIIQINSLTQY
ncbi:heavy metal efflux pump, CzcA family [Emticicia oligotrophica DSM 17448]|uniref:Heavy metal efflux pump, CzcA family n=1 Tax=Emticicia oligotrophica (strain DSM 17448 / CIP 109782 / MTCC 6937 / GPTSA100-15) TaxID=929562 RepID=A0ABM5N2Y6_EMTOG|nr:CusA/CzcA family heavy metal efflux RND transporter [Emticicia oligotrophica]AFK03726.1 heavy metal efflux pump, CzcA family [Emticicia oligotrophica DSM 17448]